MNLFIPRLCITSTGGGTGKTLFSLGLARAMLQTGISVKPYKKGPDYIDAMWLGHAAKCIATNLDPFLLSENLMVELFCSSWTQLQLQEPCIALIEGNRGLYDGMDEKGSYSTAQVTRILKCPVLLLVDCHKATRTLAAIIKGMVEFEPDLTFSGIILNNIGSSRHEKAITKALEIYNLPPILGVMPRINKNPIPERHMGLRTLSPKLNIKVEKLLDELGTHVSSHCNIKNIYRHAAMAPPVKFLLAQNASTPHLSQPLPKIGIVRDKALWFYYPENITALEKAGAEIIYLSLFSQSKKNKANWHNLDGLYLGGGFPEDYIAQISASPFLKLISHYSFSQMPIYSECGGMIILCNNFITDRKKWPLSGILPCDIYWTSKPQGLGYVEGKIIRENPWYPDGLIIRAHEFHYSCSQWLKNANACIRLNKGKGILTKDGANYDGIIKNLTWGSYAHIFAPALPQWAINFVSMAQSFKKIQASKINDAK